MKMIMGKRKTCVKLQIHFAASFCVEFDAMNAIFTMYWAMYYVVLIGVSRTSSSACVQINC